MTIRVTISDEAMQLIRANAIVEFKQTGSKLPDGQWSVSFSRETIKRLEEHTLRGETVSDTIIRVLSTQKGLQS